MDEINKINSLFKFSKFNLVFVNLMSTALIHESGKKNISNQKFFFNWGILWNALSPLIIVFGFALLMYIGLRGGYAIEYFLFILLFWFGFQLTVGKGINLNIPKFLVNSPGATVSTIVLAIYSNYILQLFIRFLICYFVLIALNFKIHFVPLIIGFVLISLFTFSYSVIVSSLLHKSIFLKEMHVYFLTALFFTSSVLIPVPQLPSPLRDALLFNPLVHFFEWLKIPTTNIEYSFVDINYFLKFLLAMVIFTPISFFYKQKYLKEDL